MLGGRTRGLEAGGQHPTGTEPGGCETKEKATVGDVALTTESERER